MEDDFDFCGSDELMDELKRAAFECLQLNPGSEYGDWMGDMLREYPAEVVDALGCDPEEAYVSMADLWESDYCDPATGMERSFSDWALVFATEESVDAYRELVGKMV